MFSWLERLNSVGQCFLYKLTLMIGLQPFVSINNKNTALLKIDNDITGA